MVEDSGKVEVKVQVEQEMNNFRQRALIARSAGIVAIALGFVMGMYGLDYPESTALNTALGLLTTGMLAQGYALYCSVRRRRDQTPPRRE